MNINKQYYIRDKESIIRRTLHLYRLLGFEIMFFLTGRIYQQLVKGAYTGGKRINDTIKIQR